MDVRVASEGSLITSTKLKHIGSCDNDMIFPANRISWNACTADRGPIDTSDTAIALIARCSLTINPKRA